MSYQFSQIEPRIISAEELPGRTITLDITRSIKDRQGQGTSKVEITPMHVMAYSQRAWRLNPDNAKDAELILACYNNSQGNRLIVGAFIFGRQDSPDGPDCFVPSPYKEATPGRCIFLAEPAPEEVWRRYVGHYLPPRKQGEANPVKYLTQE